MKSARTAFLQGSVSVAALLVERGAWRLRHPGRKRRRPEGVMCKPDRLDAAEHADSERHAKSRTTATSSA